MKKFDALPTSYQQFAVLVESENSTSSGFYFYHHGKVYLVTAKHCLFDMESGQLEVESAELSICLVENDQIIGRQRVRVNISDLISESIIAREHDIVAVPIATPQAPTSGPRVRCPTSRPAGPWSIVYDSNNVEMIDAGANRGLNIPEMGAGVRGFDEITIGGDIYISGFPKSLGLSRIPQLDFNRPLLRRGIIGGVNPDNRTIVCDCPVYPGNSGGPVLEAYHCGNHCNKSHYGVIGVVSQFVPYVDSNSMANSGYSIVIPIDSLWN